MQGNFQIETNSSSQDSRNESNLDSMVNRLSILPSVQANNTGNNITENAALLNLENS
jgi:hypothetical protein